MLVAARNGIGRPDEPPHAPTRHGVGLGHAVGHEAAVGQLGHDHGHGVVLGPAVDQVLVDLVGQHPDPLGHRPLADGLDFVARVDGARRVGRRHEEQRLGARRPGAPRGPRPRSGSRSSRRRTRSPACPRPGRWTGVGRPVGGQHQHFVARVAEHGERVDTACLPPLVTSTWLAATS